MYADGEADYTGENPLWESTEPYYDSYYCIWDSFRSIHSLITIVDPVSQIRMMRSLVDIYRHEGWLPDCRMSLCKGFTQGGSNADVLLADTWLKIGNISDGLDWQTAYEAVVTDAEDEPKNWAVQGRGKLGTVCTVAERIESDIWCRWLDELEEPRLHPNRRL